MRPIDADALLKRLPVDYPSVVNKINDAPTLDLVPRPVTCGECDYFRKAKINKKGFLICPASGMEISENDFCSYGNPKSTTTEQEQSAINSHESEGDYDRS